MASPAGVGGGKGAVIPNEILEEIFMRVDPETLSKSVPKVCRQVRYFINYQVLTEQDQYNTDVCQITTCDNVKFAPQHHQPTHIYTMQTLSNFNNIIDVKPIFFIHFDKPHEINHHKLSNCLKTNKLGYRKSLTFQYTIF